MGYTPIDLQAIDNAGHAITISRVTQVDGTPPTVSPVIPSPDGLNDWSITAPVSVSANCSDSGSGLAGSLVFLNVGGWFPYASLSDSTDTINFTSTDNAGNAVTEIRIVELDAVAPFVPGKALLILDPKTERSGRLIKLPDFVREALKDHLTRREVLAQSPEWKETGLVFTTNIGTPISPRNMVRHFKNKLTSIGLPNNRFHDLRHTTASLLLEKNVCPKIVSELLGHSTVTLTLNTHSHIINPINKVASKEMDNMFKV